MWCWWLVRQWVRQETKMGGRGVNIECIHSLNSANLLNLWVWENQTPHINRGTYVTHNTGLSTAFLHACANEKSSACVCAYVFIHASTRYTYLLWVWVCAYAWPGCYSMGLLFPHSFLLSDHGACNCCEQAHIQPILIKVKSDPVDWFTLVTLEVLLLNRLKDKIDILF